MWLRFFRPCLARRDPRGYPTYGRDVTTPPTIKIYRERVRKKKKDGFPLPDRLKDKLRGNDKKRKSMGKMPMGHMDGTSMLRKTTAGGADVSGRHLSSSFFSSLHRLDILCWILSVHLFFHSRGRLCYAHKKSPGYGYPGAFRKKRHSPTLPQSQYHRPLRLHFCVRDGNRCFP